MLAGSGIALRLNCEMARSAPAITTAGTADKVMRAHFITKFHWKGVSIAFHNRRRICPVIFQSRIAEFLRGTACLTQDFEKESERIGSTANPLQKCYDAALMSVTWTVLVALSRVPVTVTFWPANSAGFC